MVRPARPRLIFGLEQELNPSYDWQRFERDLSIERGDERELGPKR